MKNRFVVFEIGDEEINKNIIFKVYEDKSLSYGYSGWRGY